jgi:hypothetical protein
VWKGDRCRGEGPAEGLGDACNPASAAALVFNPGARGTAAAAEGDTAELGTLPSANTADLPRVLGNINRTVKDGGSN